MAPNIFITPAQVRGDRLTVTGGDARHLTRVLRLGPGDYLAALDGTGLEYRARIIAVSRHADSLEAKIEECRPRLTEPRLRLTLGQSLAKGDKMDQVIRKCTELGFASFQPVLTERCVSMAAGTHAADRVERWRKIAAEAARQSGRAVIPAVSPILGWTEVVGTFSRYDLVILPWESETCTALKHALTNREDPRPVSVLILIGPEGGLTGGEAALAAGAGAVTVTLGPRVLRTETAGLVAGAALFYHYDELGF
ncbi:MAG: RsmE family RNA methyltransferase [Bacteroidota bacterium]